MSIFENIIVTEIKKPIHVFAEKDWCFHMEKRSCFGLSFCIDGQITYEQNGISYIASPETAVLLPRGGTYSLRCDRPGVFPVIDFQCGTLDCDTIQVFPLSDPRILIQNEKKLASFFLFEEKRLKIYSLFYEMLEQIQSEQAISKNPLHPIMNYLEQQIDNPALSNQMLADKLGISEVYFRKLFIDRYGVSPKQYILDIRLKKAQQLLSGSTFSVTNIAEKCGFSSVYHFSRIFKEKTGSSPLDYAKKHKVYHI